jgi:hypothetical protein
LGCWVGETHYPNMLATKAATEGQCGPKGSYQRYFPRSRPRRYSSPMATSTAKSKYRCMQCERTEDRCDCERYCCLCQAQMDIRLCRDGLFYCLPCRDACDYKVAD